MLSCRDVKLSRCRVVQMSRCQVVEMLRCQVVSLQTLTNATQAHETGQARVREMENIMAFHFLFFAEENPSRICRAFPCI